MFLKILIPCSLYDAFILIQENEGIAKFFTLMLEGLEQSYGV
jgi:hypothetical protein